MPMNSAGNEVYRPTQLWYSGVSIMRLHARRKDSHQEINNLVSCLWQRQSSIYFNATLNSQFYFAQRRNSFTLLQFNQSTCGDKALRVYLINAYNYIARMIFQPDWILDGHSRCWNHSEYLPDKLQEWYKLNIASATRRKVSTSKNLLHSPKKLGIGKCLLF